MRQNIDVSPFQISSFNINGTPFINGFTNSTHSFTATFDSPITAFGATFNGTSNSGITQLIAGSDVVGNVPRINDGSTGFFGFVADGSFSVLTVNSQNNNNDGFSSDNLVYASASAAVPFEFSPTLGLLAVGGIFGLNRVRKRLAVSKINNLL